MEPIPNGTEVETIHGTAIIKQAYERRITHSPFNVAIEYVYDAIINGKTRRLLPAEITTGKTIPTAYRFEFLQSKKNKQNIR